MILNIKTAIQTDYFDQIICILLTSYWLQHLVGTEATARGGC